MTQDLVADPFSHQEAVHVGPLLSEVVAALPVHLNSQVFLVVPVTMPPIFPRAALIFHPDKTLQEEPLPLYQTHLDQTRTSSLVGVHLRSLQHPDLALPVHHFLLVYPQRGTDPYLLRQETPHLGLDQVYLHPFLRPRTAADLPYLQLQEEDLRFLMNGPRHRQLPLEAIGHLCPATCPRLPPPLTPSHLPLLTVPQSVGVHHLCHRDDQALHPSHPARQLEGKTTAHLAYPRGTAPSTAMVRHRHLVEQDLFLLHQMRGHHLWERASHLYAQALFLLHLLQVAWAAVV